MEIKYTTDGKKVVVIGNLNSNEKIVQEIFIVGGKEIPSGENFVVKALHDAPAISWKESELQKLEKRYEADSKQFRDDLDRLRRSYQDKKTMLEKHITYAAQVVNAVSPETFEVLVSFLTGKITHVVKCGWDPEIVEWDKFFTLYDRENLRLISLFGSNKGNLTYGMGRYSDYSGDHDNFLPFDSYEKAFECFKTEVLNAGISEGLMAKAKKYNIVLDPGKIAKWKEDAAKSYKSYMESAKKNFEDNKLKLKNLKNL